MLRRLKTLIPFAIFRKDLFPIGADLRIDVPRLLNGRAPAVIFDVGANQGQSFKRFRNYFPGATIYAFEPVKASFQLLNANCASDARGRFFRKAIGASVGDVKINVSSGSDCSSIVFSTDQIGEEVVSQTTVDKVCEENGIKELDLVKSDTEGWDLEVCRGASRMLATGAIKLIFVEATPTPEFVKCTPLSDLSSFLVKFGYRPYAFYDFGRFRGSLTEPIDFMNVLFVRCA